MFWLEAETQAKPSSLVEWAGLQLATGRFESFYPHDQFLMFFFSPSRLLAPCMTPSLHLVPILSGNNKFKIMTALRVGAGVARKQEKGSFVIWASVSAIQRQQNTHNTYAALRTMSPRHQSGEWKGESKKGRGRGTKKQPRKTDWKKAQRPKLPVIVEMYGVVTAGYLYLHGAADLCQHIRLLVHSKWTAGVVIFTVRIGAVKNRICSCSSPLTFS